MCLLVCLFSIGYFLLPVWQICSRSALSEEATNEEEFEIEAKATLQAAADIEQEEEDTQEGTNSYSTQEGINRT